MGWPGLFRIALGRLRGNADREMRIAEWADWEKADRERRIAEWALAKLQYFRIEEYEIPRSAFPKSPPIPQSAIRISQDTRPQLLPEPSAVFAFRDELFEAFSHGSSNLERPNPGGMVMEMSRDH